MPVVSYASVSMSPPLVVVACGQKSFTLKLALKSRSFSLCLLDRARVDAMEKLGSTSGTDYKDKLAESGLTCGTGRKLDVPIIMEADAILECKLKSAKRLGDHLVLTGEAKACYASEKFKEFWDFKKYRPILYTGWRDGMRTYEEDQGSKI